MPPQKHAMLGASKAHQWLNCPPSAKWEQDFPQGDQTEAQAEGSLAHELAEDHLRKILDGKRVTTTKKFKDNPLYRPAMEEHVATYTDAVMGVVSQLRARFGNDQVEVYLEKQLDLSSYVPDGFGTADCIIVGPGVLHVFDFKYGKGVPVSATENPQLKLYALGALEEYSWLYGCNGIVLHIVQPRLNSITEWPVTREVLMEWGVKTVVPTAIKAFQGEGEYCPGEEQCRWCRCKNRCKAYNNWMLESSKMMFDDLGVERNPNELSDEEIGEMLKRAEQISEWAKKVKEYAQTEAVENNVHFPGYKLVAGRSNRKITDEFAVISKLSASGFSTDKTCKLRGITDLEDLVGEKKLTELIGEYIVKPEGKPTLVPESDKRPELTMFKEYKEEN